MDALAVMTDVDAYVDANAGRFVAELKELCSFPSIANHGRAALEPCRIWLEDKLRPYASEVQVLDEGGMPSLLAEIPGAGPRRLLLYSHYDVQPVDPLDLWESPPFEPSEREGRLFARGVADDKDDVMARLHAIEALKHVKGSLPLDLLFFCEGEEEVGSPTFERVVERHRALLRADGCLWESAGVNSSGRPEVAFGARGMLYVELRTRLLNYDQHSAWASLYESAAMYLIEALASLRDLDMHIRIDGFYEACVQPTDEDRRLMNSIDPELDAKRELIGWQRLVGNPSPERVVEQLLFTPTCNVAGFAGGYSGPGSKTVLPAEAAAKLDFRLIPEQDPDDILRKLRRHLDSHGFERVEISPGVKAEKPARSDPNSAIGRAASECVEEVFGQPPATWPFMSATGPMHPIAHTLGIPTVMATGGNRPDSRIHAPNENIHVADYLQNIKTLCRIFERFGRDTPTQ